MRFRIQMVLVLGLLALSGIGVRLYGLQVVKGQWYGDLAFRQHQRAVVTRAHRGTIHDRNGHVLALSVVRLSLFANPSRIKDPVGTASALGEILGRPAGDLEKRLRRKGYFVWLGRKLEPTQVAAIRALKVRGLGFREEIKRIYPNGGLACHVLGFSGTDNTGLEGIEARYDAALTGRAGRYRVYRNGRPRGPRLRYPELEEGRSVAGADVVLTLDLWMQYEVEQALDELVRKHAPRAATAIVLDSTTGEVLALAGRPGFDPNKFSKSPREAYRCRAVTDTYEVGSTIKPLVAAAAIAEGLTQPGDEVFCENGSWRIRGRTLHDHKPFGNLTVSGIIEKSSNIGIAKVASLLGPEVLYSYLSAFGLGRSTHVGLSGEERGIMQPWSRWTSSTMVSIPMGHEIALTPMQLATAFNCLASGGVHVAPRILLRMTGSAGDSSHRFAPMQTARVFKRELVETVMDPMLCQVVQRGTGKRAKIEGLAVAGKTGTAQKIDPETQTYSHSKHVVSFVGYAPADRRQGEPKITVMVLVDEPTKEVGGGGRVAAPVFRQIVHRIFASGRLP